MIINKKCITAVITSAVIFFGMINTVGAEVMEYTSGIKEYDIDIYDFNGSAQKSENGVIFTENQYAEYDVFLPFAGSSAVVEYESSENTAIHFFADNKRYDAAVIGTDNETEIIFEDILRNGNHTLKIDSSSQIEIKNICFKKIPRKTAAAIGFSGGQSKQTSYSEYENDLQTTYIFNVNSPVIRAANAKRYVNYANLKSKPIRIGDDTYIPAKTLAYMFGYYVECDEDNDWLMLRNENYEYVLKDEQSYLKCGNGEYAAVQNVVINESSRYYVPIEYFAEKAGLTVLKNGDYVIADYKNLVKKVVSNHMEEIENEFSSYIEETNSSKVYHVAKSVNASDSGTGDSEHPFLTLNKAAGIAKAGDTVIVHDGTYRETLRPLNSGSASNPITFKAADGEAPVISALEQIGEPTGKEGNISIYSPGWDLGYGRNQVFYNGNAIAEARHPNTDTTGRECLSGLKLSSVWPTMGNISVQKNMIATSETDLNQEDDFWNGATLISFNGRAWSLAASKIEKSEAGKLTLTDACERFWFDDEARNGDWGYITNTKNAIDVPGEWYWGDKTLYMYLPNDIPKDKLEGKKRQATINLKNRKYINIENINTIGGGMILNNTEMCVINGGEHKYVGHYTYSKDQQYGYISDANKFNLTGSPQSGELGIYMGGDSDAVINTHIEYSAGSGIYATGKYGYIENNLIEDCGYMGGYAGGIFITSTGVSNAEANVSKQRGGYGIYNNTVRRAGRSVLEMASIENPWWNAYGMEPFIASEIAYNDFSDSSITARDTGVVYIHGIMLGTDRKKFKLHDNMIWNSWSECESNMGIYFDNYSQQGEAYNNIVFYTDKNIPYTGGEVFVQTSGGFPTSFATIDDWNNTSLGILSGGKSDITKDDFPEGKRFVSGCNADYSISKEEFAAKNSQFSVSEALTRNVIVKDGTADMADDGSMLEFSDMDFGDNMNAVRISYNGDCYSMPTAFEIAVGESYEKSEKRGVLIKTTALDINQPDSDTFIMPIKGGVHNVYITKKSGAAVKIRSVQPIAEEVNEYEAYANSVVYGANYASVSGNRDNFGTLYGEKRAGKKMLINNTYGKTILKYENIYVPKTSDYFAFSAATVNEYSGSVVKVYIGDMTGEPICVAEINKNSWSDFSPQLVSLKNTLNSGVYTVWLEFCGTAYTSDFWWFSFVSEYDTFAFPENEEYVSAIAYSRTNSGEINNACNYIGSLNGDTYIVYDNVNFGEGTSRLKVKMGVDEKYAGAEVRIWEIDDKTALSVSGGIINSESVKQIGSFNTVSTGGFISWEYFDVDLNETISGRKNIVFTFSGRASGCLKGFKLDKTDLRSAYKTLDMKNADLVKPDGEAWNQKYYKQDEDGQWCIGETNAYAVFRDVDFGEGEPYSVYLEYAYKNGTKPLFAIWAADELCDENTVIDKVQSGEVFVTGGDGKQYYHNLGTSSGLLALGNAQSCSGWKKSVSKTLKLPVINGLKGKHTIIAAIFDSPAFLYNIRFSKEPLRKYAYTDIMGTGNYERINGVGVNNVRACFTSLDAGDEILWKNVDFGKGEEDVTVKLTAAMPDEYAGRPMTIMIDGEEAARFNLKSTGGWFEFEEFKKKLNFKVSGVHDVSMKFYAVGTGTVKSIAFERMGYSVETKSENGIIVTELNNNPMSEMGLDINENSFFCVGIYESLGESLYLKEVHTAKEITKEYSKIEFNASELNGDCIFRIFLFENLNTMMPLASFEPCEISEIIKNL